MPKGIVSELDAYAPLIEQGYSLIVWDYPHTERLARDVGELDNKPELSGIASGVVEAIREKTGASEMILVGNSMGAGVLLWDLASLESDPKVNLVLIAPTAYFSPDANTLPASTKAVILANPEEDYFLEDAPEFKAWLSTHRSSASDQLIAGQDHPILGSDLQHSPFAQWLLEQMKQ
jgi:pimeloyl-ACP methyl ester carboxylesterase